MFRFLWMVCLLRVVCWRMLLVVMSWVGRWVLLMRMVIRCCTVWVVMMLRCFLLILVLGRSVLVLL